jgi:competence protein ComGC
MFNTAKKVLGLPATTETVPSWGDFKDTTAIDTGIPECLLRKLDQAPVAASVEVAPVEVQQIPVGMTAKKAAAEKARAEKAATASAIEAKAEAPAVETLVVAAPSEFESDTRTAILAIAPAKTKKARVVTTANAASGTTTNERQQALFALLSREEGATIKDIQGAGYIWAAAAVCRMAERNGYTTSVQKGDDGKNRYHAKKA